MHESDDVLPFNWSDAKYVPLEEVGRTHDVRSYTYIWSCGCVQIDKKARWRISDTIASPPTAQAGSDNKLAESTMANFRHNSKSSHRSSHLVVFVGLREALLSTKSGRRVELRVNFATDPFSRKFPKAQGLGGAAVVAHQLAARVQAPRRATDLKMGNRFSHGYLR